MRTLGATLKLIAFILALLVANLTPFVLMATLLMFSLFVLQQAEMFLGVKK
jgi:hypothetical protein